MAPASDVCLERDVQQQIVSVSEAQRPIKYECVAETGPDAFSTPLMRPAFGQSMCADPRVIFIWNPDRLEFEAITKDLILLSRIFLGAGFI